MRVAKFSYIALALLIASTISFPCAQAQIPVTDTPGLKQNIKNTMQSIKESKTVTDSVAFAKKTSTAIGDAKKSVSEYVLKNKKKIEEKIKKAKEYKERVEKYKKEYDEYKKQYEKYKSQVEDGIADAKGAIDTAKGAIDTAKDVAGGISDMAQSKLDEAKGKAGLNGASGGESGVSGEDGSASANASANASGEGSTGTFDEGGSETTAGGGTSADLSAADAQSQIFAGSDILSGQKAKIAVESPTAVSARQPFASGNAELTRSSSAIIQAGEVNKALMTPAARAKVVSPQKSVTSSKFKAQTTVDKSVTLKQEKNTLKKTPVSKEKTPMRRGFKALEQRSDILGLSGFATLNQSTPLAFASIMGMSDGGINQDGDMIIPSALAMSCDIGSKDALEKGVLDACMVRINDMQKGAQVEQLENGAVLYRKGLRTYAAAYIAEAVKAKNDTVSFTGNVIDPIDFADTTTETDDYANIGEMSKAITTTINGLLKIHSTELAMDIYQNYGTYKFSSPPEDEE